MFNRFHSILLVAVALLVSSCGSGNSTATDTALDSITVSVVAAAPSIATQPVGVTVAAGQVATLTVSASGGATLAYQWRRDGIAIAGANAASWSGADAGAYEVVVANSAGSVTSALANVTIASASGAPAIVAQPGAQTAAPGASVTLTASSSGSGTMRYQWRHDGVAITGANAVSLTIASVRAQDAGNYDVIVTNPNGSATSAAAALTLGASSHDLDTYHAAMAFYATLDAARQTSVQQPWSLNAARRWSNLPAATVARNGLALGSLSMAQQAAATALIKTALGDTGSSLQFGVQTADDYLADHGAGSSYGAGNYAIAFLGAPSSTGFWMLQLSGHQLTWNLAFNGSYNAPTPVFLGSDQKAAFVQGGVSVDPMLVQRSALADLGAALVNYPAAKLSGAYSGLLFGPNGSGGIDGDCQRSDDRVPEHGALYSRLSATDQARAQAAIRAYVTTQAPDNAHALLGAYLSSAALAQTYVAYAGTGSAARDGDYLRIEGPRLWLEFLAKGGAIDGDIGYNSVWRDKFADYGGKCA
ncbi:MAG: DUF3500 domain-containing protein [Pseudomonadota bacterium]|nr:DUF3500 domain-containing protein [Pseudomonadota bacterium]